MTRMAGHLLLCSLVLALTRLGSGLPVLASLQPPSGPSKGGTSVTVTGSGFVVGSSMCRFAKETVAASVVSSTKVLLPQPWSGAPRCTRVTCLGILGVCADSAPTQCFVRVPTWGRRSSRDFDDCIWRLFVHGADCVRHTSHGCHRSCRFGSLGQCGQGLCGRLWPSLHYSAARSVCLLAPAGCLTHEGARIAL